MDFHSLSRKELQALCKKNKIPANMTNVAMANALADLPQVDGLDEFLNPDVQNVPITPAVPSSKRTRAPAVSTRRKKEDDKPTGYASKTPAASNSKARPTSAYNTRRSVRLVEKTLSKMSLMETEEADSLKDNKISEKMSSVSQQIEESADTETEETDSLKDNANSEEMSSISQQMEESANTEKGGSSQTVSTDVLEKAHKEVDSLNDNEISEDMISVSQQIEESTDTEKEGSSETVSTDDLEKTNDVEVTSSEKDTGNECQSNDSKQELQFGSAVDKVEPALQAEPQEYAQEINGSEAPSKDMNSCCYEGEPQEPSPGSGKCYNSGEISVTKSIDKEVDANNDSDQISESGDESDADLTKSIEKEVDVNDEADHEISPCAEDDASSDSDSDDSSSDSDTDDSSSDEDGASSDSDDASTFEDDDASVEVTKDIQKVGNDNLISEPMPLCEEETVEKDDSVEDEHSNVANIIQNSELTFDELKAVGENLAEISVPEDIAGEKHDPLMVDREEETEESMEKDAISENPVADIQVGDIEPSSVAEVDCEEEPEAQEIKISSNLEESEESVEKDAISENSVTGIQIWSEPSSEGSLNVHSVTSSLGSSLDRNEAEAEPETTDIQIDNGTEDDSKEHAAAEKTQVSAADETLSTITYAPICDEHKTSENAVEKDQTDSKISNQENNEEKNKLNYCDLHQKSMGEIKRMLKNMSLDGKANKKSSNAVNKEVEKKRTALQALPENQMRAGDGGQ